MGRREAESRVHLAFTTPLSRVSQDRGGPSRGVRQGGRPELASPSMGARKPDFPDVSVLSRGW